VLAAVLAAATSVAAERVSWVAAAIVFTAPSVLRLLSPQSVFRCAIAPYDQLTSSQPAVAPCSVAASARSAASTATSATARAWRWRPAPTSARPSTAARVASSSASRAKRRSAPYPTPPRGQPSCRWDRSSSSSIGCDSSGRYGGVRHAQQCVSVRHSHPSGGQLSVF
jgi:hypothetical protein